MKIVLPVILLIFTVHETYGREELFTTCPEIKGSKFEIFSRWLSVEEPYNGSTFYFASRIKNDNGGLLEINSGNLSALTKSEFDVSSKTYVIIHGFRSNCKKPWVLEMKDKILEKEKANIILVDWSDGSYSWNYVDSVRTTLKVSEDLTQLLLDMKSKVHRLKGGSPSWNHLHFIGHSLGAHIAGQTGYLLKKADKFFKLERITGLDPARPCFIKAELSNKLDKNDADFVDIIHTQTGQGQKTFGFGLKEPIGHVDFYVNGGVLQSACQSDSLLDWVDTWDDMICSHKIAAQYFIESLNDGKSCKFEGHPWDQTYTNAVEILENVKNNKPCRDCVEMGKKVANPNKETKTFLVFASTKAPYCSLKKSDIAAIERRLELVKPPKEEKTLWNYLFDNEKKK